MQQNYFQQRDQLKNKYPIPRRMSKKYFFGLSVFDLILLTALFGICNLYLTKLFENRISDIARIIWINLFPSVFLYLILHEDKTTGESISEILQDALRFAISSKQYEYKGRDQ